MYRVAAGRAITTGRGIRGAGAEVRPADFKGDGEARLADLLLAGLVTFEGGPVDAPTPTPEVAITALETTPETHDAPPPAPRQGAVRRKRH